MTTVHLQFTSLIYLSAFRRYAKATQWEIDLHTMSVQCNCTTKELKAALRDFHAIYITSELNEMHDQKMAVA